MGAVSLAAKLVAAGARAAILTAVVVVLVACAGPLRGMHEVTVNEVSTTLPANRAALVSLRPSTVGYAIASSVFRATRGALHQ